MYDKRYIEYVPKNRLTCRYKRLEQRFKGDYQKGGSLFRQLDIRPDRLSPEVEEIKKHLLRRAVIIIQYNDVLRLRNEMRLLDKLIEEKMNQLP